MADPVTMMMAVGMGSTIAGGAVKAYGEHATGGIEKQMYDYRSAVALEDAKYQQNLGERKVAELGIRQKQEFGRTVAGLAGSGFDIRRGSAAEVQESQRAVDKIEQQDIRDAAARRALNEQQQAQLYTAAGKQAKWGGDISAVGTLLGTGASVASKWTQMSMYG